MNTKKLQQFLIAKHFENVPFMDGNISISNAHVLRSNVDTIWRDILIFVVKIANDYKKGINIWQFRKHFANILLLLGLIKKIQNKWLV